MRKLSGYGPSIVVLLTAAVVLFAGPRAVQRLSYEHTRSQIIQARHNLESPEIGGVLERINQAYRDIARVVEPSVVHISAQYLERDALGIDRIGVSTGSGWIYDEDGHVVTNHHVIQNAVRIDVQLYNGTVREATLIGADPSTDIAVIRIAEGLLHPAALGDVSAPVKQGDLVFAFGSPFDFRFSMSAGVVSGKDRSVGVIRDESGRRLGYENFIQVDAAINPGNSGGPLTDYRGRVIGMNTAIATGRRGSSLEDGQFAGIGLAIPLDMIQPVVTQLVRNGVVEKGFLGVNVPFTADENNRRARELGFTGTGVVITGLRAGEAAEVAGVQVNDIVTQINGRPVSSVPQLQSIVSSILPGEVAHLTVWRRGADSAAGGETLEIPVPLARLDTLRVTGRLSPNQPRDSLVELGIARMATSTPPLATDHQIEYRPGVLIQEVVPNSRLARRIAPGAVIVSVGDAPVRNVDEFINALRQYDLRRPGAPVTGFDPQGQWMRIFLQID